MSNLNANAAVTRRTFISKFVEKGLTYQQAGKAYDTVTQIFADAVVSGQKISIGRVMAIVPVKRNPRTVSMGFGGIKKIVHLTSRIVFKAKIHREFLGKHSLRWNI